MRYIIDVAKAFKMLTEMPIRHMIANVTSAKEGEIDGQTKGSASSQL